jgi:hypothetical protein
MTQPKSTPEKNAQKSARPNARPSAVDFKPKPELDGKNDSGPEPEVHRPD